MSEKSEADKLIKDLFERYPSVDSLLREACYLTYIKCRKQIDEAEMLEMARETVKRIHGENIWREWRRRLKKIIEIASQNDN
jgi:hypothetical protein